MARDGADPAIGLGDALAQRPEIRPLGQRLREGPVRDEPRLGRFGEQSLELGRRIHALGQAEIDEHRPVRQVGEGQPPLGHGLGQKGEALPMHEFEPRYQRPEPPLRAPSSSSAAAGSRTARSAAPSAAGGRTSFRLAAVMIPSVPSAPIRRLRRS